MTIYTKKGDKGETGLFSSDKDKKIRVSKASQTIKTIGAVDELNSYTGVIISESDDSNFIKNLIEIQSDLLTVGSIIAGSKLKLNKNKVKRFEKSIDEMDKVLPPLKNFILPGGTKIAAKLQYMRSLVRKAEREVVTLSKERKVDAHVLIYINRLSDFIYTLARYENWKNKFKDQIWKK